MSDKILSEEMINEFYDYNSIRHQATKLPKEAYLYFPQAKEVIDYDNKNLSKLTRKIFEGGLEFICYEKGKLEELENEIIIHNKKKNSKKLFLPEDWKEYNTLRFLQATQFNTTKTIEIINSHLDWRKENISPKLNNKVMEILNLGFLYIHGRDNRYRPIIHINSGVFIKHSKKYNSDEWCLATIYFMEYTIQNLMLPGQIENWDIICDLKDVSVISLPSDLKKILGILQNNYRCRLFTMFIVNVGTFFNMIWGIIKKIIDVNTEKKIKILKASNLIEIFSIINPCQIEKKYGGKAEDLKSYFFPPIFPSEYYLLDSEKNDTNKIFINEEEYKKKIISNQTLLPSPYIKYSDQNLSSPISNDNSKKNSENDIEKTKKTLENFQPFLDDHSKIEKLNQNDDSSINDCGSDLINFKKKQLKNDKNLASKDDSLKNEIIGMNIFLM